MKKIPTILLTAILGIAAESALCVISVVSVLAGGWGPCGPTGNAPAFVSVIHQPGFWLAGFVFGDTSPLCLPLAVAVTAIFLTIVAFIILRLVAGRTLKD